MTSSAHDPIARTIERIQKINTCMVSAIACVEYHHAMRASCSFDRTLITLIRFFNNIYYVVRRRDKKCVMSDCLCSCRYRSNYQTEIETNYVFSMGSLIVDDECYCRPWRFIMSPVMGWGPFRAMSYRKLIRRPVQFDRIVYIVTIIVIEV